MQLGLSRLSRVGLSANRTRRGLLRVVDVIVGGFFSSDDEGGSTSNLSCIQLSCRSSLNRTGSSTTCPKLVSKAPVAIVSAAAL